MREVTYDAGLKERFLAEDEIVENIVVSKFPEQGSVEKSERASLQENATSTIHWTIHRPKRGWYIRIRAPSFPPGSFIALTPVPQSSPYHAEAALTFACRTNPQLSHPHRASGSRPKGSLDSDVTLTGDATTHSYPPTPPTNPTVRVQPPSPRTVQAKLAEIPEGRPAAQVVTPFILTPHSTAHIPEQKQLSVVARVMAALKNHAPSHNLSFTLSPMPVVPQGQSSNDVPVLVPTPLLTYHDKTPVWTARSTHGLLEVDQQRERELGIQPSFYVAVALTYLEFLTEREVGTSPHPSSSYELIHRQSFLAATAD